MNAESADTTSPNEVILEPTDLDILHGRDDFSIHHIGNKCFRTVINCSFRYYVNLKTRSEKIDFISAIVITIHSSEGRFLHRRPCGGGWEQDDFRKARQMVGQALRDVVKNPEMMLRKKITSLVNAPELLCYHKAAYDFDWKGMVKEAQRLQSEMNSANQCAKSLLLLQGSL